jgi:hypothetical protein
MKKLILLALIVLFITPISYGGIFGGDKTLTYYGYAILPRDTIWIPGRDVTAGALATGGINGQPSFGGISLTDYRHIGVNFTILNPDSTITDTFFLSLWTGYVGGYKDSLRQVSPIYGSYGDSAWSPLADQAVGSVRKWMNVLPPDSAYIPRTAAAYFDPYTWVRVRLSQSITAYGDSSLPGGDLYTAAGGDSVHDWKASTSTNLKNMVDDAIGTPVYTDYINVSHEDSVAMLTLAAWAYPTSVPATIDSVVIRAIASESLVTIASDTLGVNIMFGDTSLHGFGLMAAAGQYSLARLVKHAVAGSHAYTTCYYTFTTSPGGYPLTPTNLDSLMVIIDPVHVDTLANGSQGILKIVALWAEAHGSTITGLQTTTMVKWRCIIDLRE